MPANIIDDLGLDLDELDLGDGSIDEMIAELDEDFGEVGPHTEVKVSKLPDCDFCSKEGHKVPARYDGKTTFGPWANMCQAHFAIYGIGLGLGRGQRLVVEK